MLWSPSTLLLIVPVTILDHTAFCTILESFDGKGCGYGMDMPPHDNTPCCAYIMSRASTISVWQYILE